MPSGISPLRARKKIDSLTTQMADLAVVNPHGMQELGADLFVPQRMVHNEPYMLYRILSPQPVRVSYRVDLNGQLLEEVSFTHVSIYWTYQPDEA
jgi:hypothetical protein